MNLKDTFLLPWKAAQRGMRWMVLLMFAGVVIGAIAYSILALRGNVWVTGAR